MNKAYLLTGGNLGNRLDNLHKAADYIEQYCGKIVLKSSVYETAAWGLEDQPDFYNQAFCINTKLTPHQLMEIILHIELKMGRIREQKMGPRIIDIDILLYGSCVVNEDHLNELNLVIPHPRMQDRRFVLLPLAEIAPGFIHPVLNKTIAQLLEASTDNLNVYKIG